MNLRANLILSHELYKVQVAASDELCHALGVLLVLGLDFGAGHLLRRAPVEHFRGDLADLKADTDALWT